jgi:hypothetical protein
MPVEGGTDAAPKEASADHVVPGDGATPPAATGCTTDADCAPAGDAAASCVTAGTCDPTWHVCILTTCAVGACKASVCSGTGGSCSVPTTYGFEAAHFSVPQGGVGAGLANAISAVWPFLFVVTTNGVVAFNVVDPTNTSPPAVPLGGIAFIPISTIAVGRRAYFIADTVGNGPSYRQAIAWVDLPQDPRITNLQATTAFVTVENRGVVAALTNGVDGPFLAYNSGLQFPAADVHPPLTDTTVLQTFSNAGLPNSAGIAASSGTRLVTYRYDPAAQFANFALVNGAGTAAAQTTTEQAVNAFGPIANQGALQTGGDGSLLWTSAVEETDDAGAATGIESARLTWLLKTGTAANFDTTLHVDLETYSPTTSAQVVGPPLWIDANIALGLAAASATSTDSTSVQIVSKSPTTVDAASRTLVSVAPGNLGVASSNGFGYLLAEDDPKNQSCSVYIFAPSCAGGDF